MRLAPGYIIYNVNNQSKAAPMQRSQVSATTYLQVTSQGTTSNVQHVCKSTSLIAILVQAAEDIALITVDLLKQPCT